MPLRVGCPSCYPQPSAAFAADRLDRLRAVAQDREPECQVASAAMAFHPGEVRDYDRVYRYPARYDWYDALSNPFLSLPTVLVDYLTRARLLGSEVPAEAATKSHFEYLAWRLAEPICRNRFRCTVYRGELRHRCRGNIHVSAADGQTCASCATPRLRRAGTKLGGRLC